MFFRPVLQWGQMGPLTPFPSPLACGSARNGETRTLADRSKRGRESTCRSIVLAHRRCCSRASCERGTRRLSLPYSFLRVWLPQGSEPDDLSRVRAPVLDLERIVVPVELGSKGRAAVDVPAVFVFPGAVVLIIAPRTGEPLPKTVDDSSHASTRCTSGRG